MRAQDVKLLAHRWDLHAIQALANHDFELLTRIFKELPVPEGAINTKVQTFGFGAPAQFHSYGFFAKNSTPESSITAAPRIEHVVEGDTLLLLSLRQYDPQSAAALITAGASLSESNSVGESPIHLIFRAYATIKVDDKRSLSSQQTIEPTVEETRILSSHTQYRELFTLVQESIDCF